MNAKQRNTLLVSGIVSSLLSLPLTWMTISGVELQGPFLDQLSGSFAGFSFDVTGLNGFVTLLFNVPIWLVVCIAIAASALQLMRASNNFAVSTTVIWVTAIAGVVWAVIPVGISLSSGKATLGVGTLFGWFGAIAPFISLMRLQPESSALHASGTHPS